MRNETAFFELVAGDLMSRDPMTVPCEMTLKSAAHLLAEARVSGVPVVDRTGRCVGVLSATDFVKWVGASPAMAGAAHTHEVPSVCSDWQVIDVEEVPAEELVATHMTRDPVTVPPEMPIRELARHMLDAHIHRVVVVNAEQHPVGLVSTTDILAALAYAGGRN
jgi:CBS domain-containing protein